MQQMNKIVLLLCFFYLLGCTTSPTGRQRLLMIDDRSIAPMAAESFNAMKKNEKIISKGPALDYANCVLDPLIIEVKDRYGVSATQWEVVVFDSPTVNAFAMPGGKVGVYTGLMDLAETPDQLAAVMGHELAHVVAQHSAERYSTAQVTTLGLTAAGAVLSSNENQQVIMAALGLGAQIGVQLPFSRIHESEADEMGQEIMAQAGFNPAASIRLWELMGKNGGARPPELLSTHPDPSNRAQRLRQELSITEPMYQLALNFGKKRNCKVPPKPMTTVSADDVKNK